ncbi:hypothetical protein TNCT_485631 [Trichonephila clavata]|uniref:Uncharacterized protein n=1 Tax=Trichonephila clavata TaxID=2740835 RepID=A0A8X6JTK8_TRICU|nr:hypothetical protein TNCT_485631 [Trichonephila clavata]
MHFRLKRLIVHLQQKLKEIQPVEREYTSNIFNTKNLIPSRGSSRFTQGWKIPALKTRESFSLRSSSLTSIFTPLKPKLKSTGSFPPTLQRGDGGGVLPHSPKEHFILERYLLLSAHEHLNEGILKRQQKKESKTKRIRKISLLKKN